SFDVPVAGIPFLAEAGLSGGVDAEFGTRFVVTRFGEDGLTFCPEGFSKVFFGLNGHAGLYAQVLWGLGRLEGGLYADGELSMSLPSLEKQMHLYGGVYAKACCWKWCSEWSYGIEFDSTNNTLEWRKTETKTKESENMDLLCLKDSWSEKTRGKTFNDPLNVLAYNVVGNAYPRIVLTDNNTGLAVWTDINKVDNNSFQSDIWWSEYSPDTGWSTPKSTNTTNKCEYNPTLTLATDRNGEQKIVITYLMVDSVVNMNSSIKNFYKNNSINTATWSIEKGCSFSGGNITALNGTINSKQACYAGNNTIYMVYLFDTNPSPWENGNGNITIVKGLINNSRVDWQQTKVLKTLKTFNFTCDPSISFLTPNVGGITYIWFNNGLNETTLLATTSGLNNFTELTIRKTNLTVEHATCSAFNNSLMVSWIENRSSILACKVTLDELKNWVIKNVTTVYNGLSVSYIKPVYSDNKTYYLFQVGEKFIPFIIELLNNGSWGKIRQISLNETYSFGQLDGDSNPSMSQMIYIRDTSVEKWEVGHWVFNEGNGNVTVDSSDKNNNGYITGLSNNATYWFKNNGGNNNLTEEYGYGLGFRNKTGYVYILHNNSLNTSHEFTVTGWIRVFNHSNNASLLGKNGSWLLFEHNGFLSLKLWEKNHSIIIKDIAALPLNTWVFTTVVYDRGIVKVSVSPMSYENVSKKYILNDTSVNTSVSPLIIGGFNGTVDEIRLFNRAITNEIIDRIWFAPHATLGGIHDVVVQQLPSFASFEINVNGLKNLDENVKITTQDNVEFTGIPCNFSFNWDFGDGTTVTGNPVYHRFKKPGFYHITMKATNPETGAVTPFTKTLHVWDTTPPLFNGLEHAQNGNCYVKLNWSAASDDSPFVLYYVYMSKNRSFNYNQPVLVTLKTRCNITNLEPGENYYFIVKAKDSAGNIDNNTVVKTATPFDHKPPVFDGIKKALNISNSPSKILLSWEKAKDCSPVVYNIYVSTTPSGHNLSKPYDTTTNTWYLFKCSQNRRHYFIVKAEDTWGNKENNTIEKNATPVWENTPPEINNVKAEPTLQEAGETVNITCNVTDNYIVENVHVNITYPDGVIQNLSMTQNKKNDIYHLNKTYNIVGVYNYFIWTVDECNNSNQSNTYSFIIQDNTPPKITNVIDYPDPQKEKGYVNITCNVSDNSQVNTVKVNITYPD
ncbi:MAG: PKD domain-containing protein, partial [Methermicoccaceae archaeon]